MANLPKNTLARKIATKTLIPDIQAVVTVASSWDQGDLLVFDALNKVIKKPALETEGATFIGISPIKVVDGKPPKAYVTDVDASAAIPAQMGPEYGDMHRVLLKEIGRAHV